MIRRLYSGEVEVVPVHTNFAELMSCSSDMATTDLDFW